MSSLVPFFECHRNTSSSLVATKIRKYTRLALNTIWKAGFLQVLQYYLYRMPAFDIASADLSQDLAVSKSGMT